MPGPSDFEGDIPRNLHPDEPQLADRIAQLIRSVQYNPELFTSCEDTPESYDGFGGYLVGVKVSEDGLEFVPYPDIPTSGGGSIAHSCSYETSSSVTVSSATPIFVESSISSKIWDDDSNSFKAVSGSFYVPEEAKYGMYRVKVWADFGMLGNVTGFTHVRIAVSSGSYGDDGSVKQVPFFLRQSSPAIVAAYPDHELIIPINSSLITLRVELYQINSSSINSFADVKFTMTRLGDIPDYI